MEPAAIESVDEEPGVRGSVRFGPVLREIAVGGLAGLIAGTLIGGIGGRFVMRLAAILVPDAVGAPTDAGNIVGAVTLEGTLLLLVFGGLLAGIVAGTVWVIARPWLPPSTRDRALISIPLALAVGVPLVIEARNPDFALLGFQPVVVGALVLLVAIVGPAVVQLEGWLDRRLPAAKADNRLATAFYTLIALIGLMMTFGLTVPALMQLESALVVIGLIVVGFATLLMWGYRSIGQPRPVWPAPVARSALVVVIVVGVLVASIEIAGALGLA